MLLISLAPTFFTSLYELPLSFPPPPLSGAGRRACEASPCGAPPPSVRLTYVRLRSPRPTLPPAHHPLVRPPPPHPSSAPPPPLLSRFIYIYKARLINIYIYLSTIDGRAGGGGGDGWGCGAGAGCGGFYLASCRGGGGVLFPPKKRRERVGVVKSQVVDE